ncbi:synaptonemal complex protein 1 [Ambystoma mexicanum]|uniref:synaptonemal complex protein 1 n=1 Tax=Ambystoma mexicanum TaxID=8296 RepID=UPI0037E82C4C
MQLDNSRVKYEETVDSYKTKIEAKNIAEAKLCAEVNKLNMQLDNSRVQYEETVDSYKKEIEEKNIAEAKLCAEVNKLNMQLDNSRVQYEETVDSYKKEIEEKNIAEAKLCAEVEKMKLVAEEATQSKKETDIRCQHKIAEMVALMEKHKHQYDKMVEEKHTELGLYKSKEQETTSAKLSLEIELSYSKNEVLSLKKQLQKEIEEKDRYARELNDSGMLKKELKHKITQTAVLETPKRSTIKLDPKSVASSNKSVAHHFALLEQSKKSENKDICSWTPARSTLCTPRKTYTVKTPPKYEKAQKERINSLAEEASVKKRKVALAFDCTSDSSETTDLLSMVMEDEIVNKLYVDHSQGAQTFAETPKKVYTASTLKSPGSAIKRAAVRKMREAGWSAVANMDRKKKMKAAEKLFN